MTRLRVQFLSSPPIRCISIGQGSMLRPLVRAARPGGLVGLISQQAEFESRTRPFSPWLTPGHTRMSSNGRTPGFHPDNTGSTPVVRSRIARSASDIAQK
jgi:hypothetical protein